MAAPDEEASAVQHEGGEWDYVGLNDWTRYLLFVYVTFPGIVLHELGHYLGAKLAGLRVVKVGWYRVERTRRGAIAHGFVRHELPRPGTAHGFNLLFVALLPAFLPNLVGVWLLVETLRFGGPGASFAYADPLALFLAFWVGFSAVVHGIPSRQDFRIAGVGLARLRAELGRARGEGKLLRLAEYLAGAGIYAVLSVQQLFNGFGGGFVWFLLVWWATLTFGPGLL